MFKKNYALVVNNKEVCSYWHQSRIKSFAITGWLEHKLYLPEMFVSVFKNVSAATNHNSKERERPSSTQGP